MGYDEVETVGVRELSEDEKEYLTSLFDSPYFTEEEAKLILTFIGEWSTDWIGDLRKLLEQYPALIKQVFLQYRSKTEDHELLADTLLRFVKTSETLCSEYQLFWLGRMSSYLSSTASYSDLWFELLGHPYSTGVSRAALLEQECIRFGMLDEKTSRIKSGGNGWEQWAAIYGIRKTDKASRNTLAKYSHSNYVSELVSRAVSTLP